MRKMPLIGALAGAIATALVAACSGEAPSTAVAQTAGAEAGGERASAADDALDPRVLAALEAAARGEAFEEELHPETARTGKPMSPLQAAFSVMHYGIDVRIMPSSRSIEGTVEVRVEALERLAAIELDLDPRMEIHSARHGDTELVVTRNEDRFTVDLPAELAAGERATVAISYSGKPFIALAPPWHGGFVWSEVDGVPWFATAVQTDGCDLWFPCKDTYADKPDEGVDIAISAPRGVKVASIGKLLGMDEGEDGFDTWRWRTRHPTAGYSIAINGGPYELIEVDYEGINGTTYPIQFWALEKNADKARQLIETDAIPHLAFFEQLIGPYPWGDEKVGFVETPHLGMEHQTINGYGEGYQPGKHGFDQLLHHELAHEWFGNVMTHALPQDAWLHEGYGAYMQPVYAQETTGHMGYFDRMFDAYMANTHCSPVVDPSVGDVGEAFKNRDIYTKGAWMLHSLRNLIGEEDFWAGTRKVIYDTTEPWDLPYPIQARYRSTEEFIEIMSEVSGQDIAWLVETYLYEADMPELRSTRADGRLDLRWAAPGGRAFPMPVTVQVNGIKHRVEMSDGSGSLDVPGNAWVVIDPESRFLRALPIIGNCEEQTGVRVNRSIERWTRMAREYGWQRD